MTESLKAKIRAAKSDKEVWDVFEANQKDVTVEDLAQLRKALMSSGELSEDELESIVGGAWWNDVGDWFMKTAKKIKDGVTDAYNTVSDTVSKTRDTVRNSDTYKIITNAIRHSFGL